MSKHADVEDLVLNYDPEAPQERFRSDTFDAALLSAEARLPAMVPWPADLKPTGVPLDPAPAETDDLTRFAGYDAVVVTWTAAEAAALAALFTPGHPVSSWYEYRYDVDQYVPLVTGRSAPFNDASAEMARYFHSLGLYFPCQIGTTRVLLFKSGLHLDYDGPAIPVRRLMQEIASTVKPKIFITTGTGGGIGTDVKLGDVVIAGEVRFSCQQQFQDADWANSTSTASPLPDGTLDAITPDLTNVNGAKVVGGSAVPKMWSGGTIVTTDFFGLDDSSNHCHLQGLGLACDMGDAMVGLAVADIPDMKWYAIRNASDPQIPDPTGNFAAAKEEAGKIYLKYGVFTTAASAIATWAVISRSFA